MKIENNESRLCSIGELISNYKFSIPGFQRLYAWGKTQWESLAIDLRETAAQEKSLFLGLAVVGKNSQNNFLIIDGQQRLTTIALLLHAKQDPDFSPKMRHGAYSSFISPQETDAGYFLKLLFEKHREEPKTYSQRLMRDAIEYFKMETIDITLEHIKKSSIILYCAEDIQKGTDLYERVNLRGLDIAKIELIKSRLFDIAYRHVDHNERLMLEQGITNAFKSIYEKLNPPASAKGPTNLDAFLNVHWVLYKHAQPKTTDFAKIYDFVETEIVRTSKEVTVAENIWKYIRDLDQFASVWKKLVSPLFSEFEHPELKDRILSIQRLGREGAFSPLIAAVLSAWGETQETADFILFCEMTNFRQALAGDPSHSGRSKRWGIARKVIKDGYTYKQAINELFWETCPWWNSAEMCELDEEDPDHPTNKFAEWRITNDNDIYVSFRHYLHYFFWEYARWLSQHPEQIGKERTEDIQIFTNQLWEDSFRALEIEHIFPQNPDKEKMPWADSKIKKMRNKVHSLGNLTLIPPTDNKALRNSIFSEKKELLCTQYKHLNFNAALENEEYTGSIAHGIWSPINCEKRIESILIFAQERW